jgi:hypothetical protein
MDPILPFTFDISVVFEVEIIEAVRNCSKTRGFDKFEIIKFPLQNFLQQIIDLVTISK